MESAVLEGLANKIKSFQYQDQKVTIFLTICFRLNA